MELILLKDVKNLGKEGEIVNVKDGYGRHLLSEGVAGAATAQNRNDLKLKKIREDKEAAAKLLAAQELKGKLDSLTIKVSVKQGKEGKIFGSVSSKEIAEAFKKQVGVEIDKKKILLPEPLKEIGRTDVAIKLHPSVSGVLHVEITGQ